MEEGSGKPRQGLGTRAVMAFSASPSPCSQGLPRAALANGKFQDWKETEINESGASHTNRRAAISALEELGVRGGESIFCLVGSKEASQRLMSWALQFK